MRYYWFLIGVLLVLQRCHAETDSARIAGRWQVVLWTVTCTTSLAIDGNRTFQQDTAFEIDSNQIGSQAGGILEVNVQGTYRDSSYRTKTNQTCVKESFGRIRQWDDDGAVLSIDTMLSSCSSTAEDMQGTSERTSSLCLGKGTDVLFARTKTRTVKTIGADMRQENVVVVVRKFRRYD
jgi:hypothetical protein